MKMHDAHGADRRAAKLNVNFQTGKQEIRASEETRMTFSVSYQETGETLDKYESVHDRLMHLIVANSDLSYFKHLHPVLNEGKFTISHVFPEAGRYKLWTDMKPRSHGPVLAAFMVEVSGEPVHVNSNIIPDENLVKNFDDYQIMLSIPGNISSDEAVDIIFRISDKNGKPVTDLSTIMGAGGHCVIIKDDLARFLHVHPKEEVEENWAGGPDVTFMTIFPESGIYKIWGQFLHNGKIITADFAVRVA